MKILLLIIAVIIISGCGTTSDNQYQYYLPTDATNITDIGNGWVTFELDTLRFMYHNGWTGNSGYESVTQIK